MTLTDRDKKLLVVLVCVVVLAAAYQFAYKPIATRAKDLEDEINQLQVEYNQLQGASNKAVVEKNLKKLKAQVAVIEKKFPAIISQEWIIKQVDDIENSLELYFPSITFNEIEIVNTLQTESYTESAVKIGISLDFKGSYAQLKGLLDYFHNMQNRHRMVIDTFAVSNDLEDGFLNGTLSIAFYGVVHSEELIRMTALEGYSIGKTSIFKPFDGYSYKAYNDDALESQDEEDFFIMLKPITSDYTTVIIGESNDVQAESYVYEDKNDSIAIELHVLKEGDTYYYRYKTPRESMPENYKDKIAFEPGENIKIKVYGEDRNSEKDKSGVNATIINDTDKPAIIVQYHDDKDDPRFKLNKTKGDVMDARR